MSPGMPLTAVQLGSEPKVLWKFDEAQPDVASPLATDKYVLMAASGGTVTCVDAATVARRQAAVLEEPETACERNSVGVNPHSAWNSLTRCDWS